MELTEVEFEACGGFQYADEIAAGVAKRVAAGGGRAAMFNGVEMLALVYAYQKLREGWWEA